MDRAQIVELKRFAKQLEQTGGGEETRAAARAIVLLADEVESLRRELERERPARDDGLASWLHPTFSTGSPGSE